ncbi:MAG: class II aldolase/adducin family protein [Chloroflexota bacterium]|nr:class II aldolase/adducin family protein [Chloroflexota bacterium]
MAMDRESARTALQAAGRYMIEHDLTWGNAGNMSARTGEGRALITASGTQLGELADEDLVEFVFSEQHRSEGGRRPSKERPMHRAVYEMRPEINAVLHAAPFYATLLACSAVEIPSDWFVEAMYYLERVARVPYHHPGSEALGEVVRSAALSANVLLLDNHGVLVYDTSVREALMALHTLELTCRMAVTARAAQLPIRSLSTDVVEDFLERSGYRPRREWPS